MTYGATQPIVAMCMQCRALRVDNPGDRCPTCQQLLENRIKMDLDHNRVKRTIRYGVIASGLVVLALCALWIAYSAHP